MARAEQDQGQPGTRRNWIGYDQHGRKWQGSAEKSTGYPVGMIQPMGWRAPWRPPQGPNYFVFSREEPSRFRINYEGMLEERLKDQKEHDDDRQRAAVVRGWDPSDPEKQDALDKIVGRRDAMQAPEIIVACMQGDKWILGLTDKVNEKVAQFLPKKVDRKTALLSKFPDFTAQDEDALERNLDLEEVHDPDAIGGKKLPRKPKAKSAA